MKHQTVEEKTRDFIAQSKLKYGSKFDYQKTIYTLGTVKVTLNCDVHGEISLLPKTHLTLANGCKFCSRYGVDSDDGTVFGDFGRKKDKSEFSERKIEMVNALNLIGKARLKQAKPLKN